MSDPCRNSPCRGGIEESGIDTQLVSSLLRRRQRRKIAARRACVVFSAIAVVLGCTGLVVALLRFYTVSRASRNINNYITSSSSSEESEEVGEEECLDDIVALPIGSYDTKLFEGATNQLQAYSSTTAKTLTKCKNKQNQQKFEFSSTTQATVKNRTIPLVEELITDILNDVFNTSASNVAEVWKQRNLTNASDVDWSPVLNDTEQVTSESMIKTNTLTHRKYRPGPVNRDHVQITVPKQIGAPTSHLQNLRRLNRQRYNMSPPEQPSTKIRPPPPPLPPMPPRKSTVIGPITSIQQPEEFGTDPVYRYPKNAANIQDIINYFNSEQDKPPKGVSSVVDNNAKLRNHRIIPPAATTEFPFFTEPYFFPHNFGQRLPHARPTIEDLYRPTPEQILKAISISEQHAQPTIRPYYTQQPQTPLTHLTEFLPEFGTSTQKAIPITLGNYHQKSTFRSNVRHVMMDVYPMPSNHPQLHGTQVAALGNGKHQVVLHLNFHQKTPYPTGDIHVHGLASNQQKTEIQATTANAVRDIIESIIPTHVLEGEDGGTKKRRRKVLKFRRKTKIEEPMQTASEVVPVAVKYDSSASSSEESAETFLLPVAMKLEGSTAQPALVSDSIEKTPSFIHVVDTSGISDRSLDTERSNHHNGRSNHDTQLPDHDNGRSDHDTQRSDHDTSRMLTSDEIDEADNDKDTYLISDENNKKETELFSELGL